MTEDRNNSEHDKSQNLFSEKLRKYEDKLVKFFVDIGTRKRVNPKMLQISSYLLIHGSLTQKELKELTGLSMGTISTSSGTSRSEGSRFSMRFGFSVLF